MPQLRQAPRVWVAFSGGLDSSVLLHQVMQLQLPAVTALHINHQLSPNASQWQSQCGAVALALGCDFQADVVTVANGASLEQAARNARYSAFADKLNAGEVLLTAHHGNDQAETLLYRLVRGSGLRGLAGVPEERFLLQGKSEGGGSVIRPFLALARAELESYANAHQLCWIVDESNQNQRYDRNFLRHELVPVFERRWPHAVSHMAKTARLLAESQHLLDGYLAEDFRHCDVRKERIGFSLCLHKFNQFSWQKQKHLLRYWFGQRLVQLPSEQQLGEVQKLLAAAPDVIPCVAWGVRGKNNANLELRGCQLFRFRQRLFLVPRLNDLNQEVFDWHPSRVCQFDDGFSLSATPAEYGLPSGRYTLSFRCGGERCRPHGRAHSQSLKKLLQASGLEPWLRDRVPLVYRGSELVAVGDLWLCDGVAVADGWRPLWRFQHDFSD